MQPFGPTTRYLCPLECGWHHDVPPPWLDDIPPDYVPAPGETLQKGIQHLASDMLHWQTGKTEKAVSDHLSTHTPQQFAAKLLEQRQQNHGLKQVIEHLLLDVMQVTHHTCWAEDVRHRDGRVDIVDVPDTGDSPRLFIRLN